MIQHNAMLIVFLSTPPHERDPDNKNPPKLLSDEWNHPTKNLSDKLHPVAPTLPPVDDKSAAIITGKIASDLKNPDSLSSIYRQNLTEIAQERKPTIEDKINAVNATFSEKYPSDTKKKDHKRRKSVDFSESNFDVEQYINEALPPPKPKFTLKDRIENANRELKALGLTADQRKVDVDPKLTGVSRTNAVATLLEQKLRQQKALNLHKPIKYEHNEAVIANKATIEIIRFNTQYTVRSATSHMTMVTRVGRYMHTCSHGPQSDLKTGDKILIHEVVGGVIIRDGVAFVLRKFDRDRDSLFLTLPVEFNNIRALKAKYINTITNNVVVAGFDEHDVLGVQSGVANPITKTHNISTHPGYSGAAITNTNNTVSYGNHNGVNDAEANRWCPFTEEEVAFSRTDPSEHYSIVNGVLVLKNPSKN